MRGPNVFDDGDQLTVEAWIKPNITTGLRTLWDDHGSSGVRLIVSSSRIQFTVATEAHPEPGRTVLTPLASIVAGRRQNLGGPPPGGTVTIPISESSAFYRVQNVSN